MDRVETKGGGAIKKREPIMKRGSVPCFWCGKQGHFKAECQESVHCSVCDTDIHSESQCWSKPKDNVSNAKANKLSLTGKNKKQPRKGEKKKKARKVTSKEESSEDGDYSDG